MKISELCNEQAIKLPIAALEKIDAFSALVIKYNKKANLIASGDEGKIASRHLLDSLQPLRHPELLPPAKSRWADLGSGAGFPVLPLCLALPEIQFYAVEPRQKRFTFLKIVRSELGIKNLEIVETNAESSGIQDLDRVSCRALGSAEEDWRRAADLLNTDGVFITLKSLRDCSAYQNPPWKVIPYDLPGETQPYCLLVRQKNHG